MSTRGKVGTSVFVIHNVCYWISGFGFGYSVFGMEGVGHSTERASAVALRILGFPLGMFLDYIGDAWPDWTLIILVFANSALWGGMAALLVRRRREA
jgi:hypothetical protein